MVQALSFSESFFNNWDGETKSRRPISVAQAAFSMPKKKWERMCREVFHCSPDHVDVETVVMKVRETDTCEPSGDSDIPTTVWIDAEGYWTLDIYDDKE